MLSYDILSIDDDLIKREGAQEITSSKIFSSIGEPDEAGLASYTIFGYPGTEARKKQFAYIDLKEYFVNPHCIFELKSIKSMYMDLIYGHGEFYLQDGDIHRVETVAPAGVKSGTGVKFLYSIWNELKFDYKDSKSGVRYNRLRFIKSLDKKQVFMNKILVIPPYYRDVDVKAGGNKNEFNTIYIKIINLVQTMNFTSSMFGATTETGVTDAYREITDILIEFHEMVIKTYGGRKGFIHKYVMGKNIDFSARLVISGLDLTKTEAPSTMDVKFERCSIPLFAALKCFAPFIVNGIREIILDYLKGSEYIIRNKKSNIGYSDGKISKKALSENRNFERIKLASDWQTVLTSSYIYGLIELFHDSPEHRLDLFTLPTEDGGEVPVSFYVDDGIDIELETDIDTAFSKIQHLRLIHLFYMAAIDTISDKHIYITRYPIEDHSSTYPTGIVIIPCTRTAKLTIGDTVYDHFPVIDYEKDIKSLSSLFIDSLVLFPGYLASLGGDYDGDMISVIGVFSEEANEDARRQVQGVSNIVGIDGGTIRKLGVLTEQTIHGFTF